MQSVSDERTNKLPKRNIPLRLLVIFFLLSFPSLSFCLVVLFMVLMSNSESSGPESELCDKPQTLLKSEMNLSNL